MSWLRSHPAFFVRCAEVVPSPCCGEQFKIIGSRERICKQATGESIILIVRRLRCLNCRRIHHELPDCLVPYKRYESTCVEHVISNEVEASTIAADDTTLYRWRNWFQQQKTYLLGCLIAINARFHSHPVEVTSIPSESAHHRIGQFVGDGAGWLARVVRPLANFNLWLHTRSAF
ncbi:MAG: hypothetical protein K0Q73_7896 [Paenibacillus sp.]|jgi:hypothetical protein|nr:hypothetical protein [Paenibacillus sp.]